MRKNFKNSFIMFAHGKNGFAERSKNTNLKITLSNHKNNYVGISNIMSNVAKNLDLLAISLNVQHNYFVSLIKFIFKSVFS